MVVRTDTLLNTKNKHDVLAKKKDFVSPNYFLIVDQGKSNGYHGCAVNATSATLPRSCFPLTVVLLGCRPSIVPVSS